MKKLSRVNIAIPGELSSNLCKLHLDSIIASPKTIKVAPDFYKGKRENADGSVVYTVRDSLKLLYKNKCAYCEKLTHAPKIDHHRPKGKVVGAGNLNNGYYWLCYEWTNLLPSCTDCNSIEAKGSKYPVSGGRNNSHPLQGNPPIVHAPSFSYDSIFNTGELPLLLHPEYCIPENNFQFDKQGKIIGITPEGVETINVLKLDNADLNGWRRKIYEEHMSALESIVWKYFRPNNPISESLFDELILNWVEKIVNEANDEALEYTLFRKFILNQLNLFFILELDVVFQGTVTNKITAALLKVAA